jgi:hypothetical protein
MGDISRHRDIFLNTREVTPPGLLAKCKLGVGDLTYLEIGNYLTDVSQFRDPVFYIFAKQRIWREFIIPKVADKAVVARVIAALAGAAGLAAGELLKKFTSGKLAKVGEVGGPVLAVLGGIIATLPNDTFAGIKGADDWIDQMFGTPIERVGGDLKKRDEKHYGLVGQFFRSFVEGITQLLFAEEISNRVSGNWGKLNRIPEHSVSQIFNDFYTQYYPHEHTDQPPYVWDASRRPNYPSWYGPSRRQHTLSEPDIGIMNVVDLHYVQYLTEGLTDVELEWRKLKPDDLDGRRRMLVRMGKILHGIEDWYFHSNVVEILRMRGHKPGRGEAEGEEEFLKRFITEITAKEPEFLTASQPDRVRMQRKLFRRLRFPVYETGNKLQSGGILSKKTPSTPSLKFAYPAFPSQQDSANTLLHAMENLEHKATHPAVKGRQAGDDLIPPWAFCVLDKFMRARGSDGEKLLEEKARARGVTKETALAAILVPGGQQRTNVIGVLIDVLREWLPLIATLLFETERQRLIANVDPLVWPLDGSAPPEPEKNKGESFETDEQLKRHNKALQEVKNEEGFTENNYERAVRYLVDCQFLNKAGQKALETAFEIDQRSSKILEEAPGCGGFLIKFSLDLQRTLDEGDKATEQLNSKKDSVFDPISDNGAFNESVGSHSLMSKDTLESAPFFADAKVLASVASSSIFQIMLEQVSAPTLNKRLPWKAVLQHFIRYPSAVGGWERRALAYFRENNSKIPTYSDLPELARLVETALQSTAGAAPYKKGSKDDDLKNEYIRLETELSEYRYP